MADIAETEQKAHANRLVKLGHVSLSKKRPIIELNATAKLLLDYMVHGCPHAWVSQITRASPTEFEPDRRRSLEPGEPLKLNEAADLLRIRRRRAREIVESPAGQRELAALLHGLRSGLKARAMITLGAILEDPGDGSAASRKVRLQAASVILGEEANRAPAVTVNVNNGMQMSAGIVIRLGPNIPPTPLESETPPIIEHQAQSLPDDEGDE